MHTLPIPDALVRKVAQAAAVPRRRDDAAPAPWTHEEFEEKTAWFFTMPKNAQAEAFRRAELLWAFEDMEVPEGEKKSYLAEAWAKERGTSRATLYKWRQSVAHLERHQWAYALVPERRKGNMPGAPKADIDPENRYIVHFPEENKIVSVNSNYGGNVLQGTVLTEIGRASCRERVSSPV